MTPDKFTHAGLPWIPHIPGDPMPCPPDTKVRVLLRGDLFKLQHPNQVFSAELWFWGERSGADGEIIGWHPIEEQTSLARRVLDLLEAGDTEQAKHELRKELE